MRNLALSLLLCSLPNLVAVEPGQDLSSLALPLQEGPRKIEAFRGKVLYLDFWATWCAPCQKSLPWMSELQKRFRAKGLVVIGVSVDQKAEKLAAFLERQKPDILIGHDVTMVLANKLDIQAMPCALLIDGKGKLRHVHQGFRPADSSELEAKIEALLKEE